MNEENLRIMIGKIIDQSFDLWVANLAEEIQRQIYPKAVDSKKQLLTVKDLEKYLNLGYNEVEISSKTIITPLAIDFIKENNLKLLRK